MVRRSVLVSLSAALGACQPLAAPFDPFVNSGPAKEVTPASLAAAYDENEARAQANYGNRLLLVRAKVEGVSLNIKDKPFVNLQWQKTLLPIQLSFEPGYEGDALALNRGQDVQFECLSVEEVLGTPMLKRCRVKR